jgi:3'-5' exoribonuclease
MKIYACEINDNESVDSLFLVREKSSGLTKAGNPYLKVRLIDRSGELEARIWASVEILQEAFQKDDFVQVKGKAAFYQDRLQINISHIQKVDENTIVLSDFFPSTQGDVEEMCRTLIAIGEQITNPHLVKLLDLFWGDECFLARFKKAPASKQLHHAYLGGLLEHTLSVARLVRNNAAHYEGLNVDLLIAGAILHDVGKVYELAYHRTFDYSDEGRLLGHILIGIEKTEEKIRQIPDFPPALSVLLKHLLLSHHGQYDFGSPKKPMVVEAMVLHCLDDLDAKVNGIQQFLKTKTPEGARWTTYHPLYDQFFYSPAPDLPREVIEFTAKIDKEDGK